MKATDIGLPTFDASVSCGAYCLGGSVNMQPTTYPEFTDADEVWVRGDVVGTELERQRRELAEAIEASLNQALTIKRQQRELAEAHEVLRGLRNWHHAKTQMTEYPSPTKMLYEHMEMWKMINDFLAATATEVKP